MNSNGFSGTKIVGYEHNWDDAAGYPVQVVCSDHGDWLANLAD